jgi:hypothetical protein
LKFLAKEDSWFDPGTEVEMIEEMSGDCTNCASKTVALWRGMVDGELDEETACFCEFEVV